MERNFTLYRKLFTSTFYLSAFTFGGGYVIVPLMRKEFVEKLKWIDEKEMMDMVAIAQSSPGALAVNASVIIGYRCGGILGALITVFGTILPPLIILSVISYFYEAFAGRCCGCNLRCCLDDGKRSGVTTSENLYCRHVNSFFCECGIASAFVNYHHRLWNSWFSN